MNKNLDEKKSDYLLELALEEQLENDEDMRYWEQIERENPPHVFSERHNKRMRKIFRKARRVEYYEQYRKRALRTVAGFLVIICASVVTVTQVDAFRWPLVEFFTNVQEKSTFFGVQKEKEHSLTQNFKEYEPTYMPKGFAVVETSENDKGFYIKCQREDGQFYKFYFFSIVNDFALDTEVSMTISTEINGNKTSVVEKGNEIKILMYKGNSAYYLEAKMSFEEAYKILESIQ